MKELQEERKTLECLGQGLTRGQEGGPARLLLSTSTMSVVDPDTVDFKDNPRGRGRQKKQPRLASQSGRDMRGIRTMHVLQKMSPSTTSNALSSFASKLWYAFKYFGSCLHLLHSYKFILVVLMQYIFIVASSLSCARARSLALSL